MPAEPQSAALRQPWLPPQFLLLLFALDWDSGLLLFGSGISFGLAFLMKQPGIFFHLFEGGYFLREFAATCLVGSASRLRAPIAGLHRDDTGNTPALRIPTQILIHREAIRPSCSPRGQVAKCVRRFWLQQLSSLCVQIG